MYKKFSHGNQKEHKGEHLISQRFFATITQILKDKINQR